MASFCLAAVLLCALLLCFTGCGGGGSDETGDNSFNGSWDAQLNFIIDDCQIVEPTLAGIVDVHSISQDGAGITLESLGGFGESLSGEASADNSRFEVNQLLKGDLFGDGFFCVVRQSYSYERLSREKATVLFKRTLECNDGYLCESRAQGEAERNPA
ncbi:MAG: hypothetical protein K1X83_07595 [Oligoflexia bacterium]|nr:hypothetical protein [Oligoflexia bacterium]